MIVKFVSDFSGGRSLVPSEVTKTILANLDFLGDLKVKGWLAKKRREDHITNGVVVLRVKISAEKGRLITHVVVFLILSIKSKSVSLVGRDFVVIIAVVSGRKDCG